MACVVQQVRLDYHNPFGPFLAVLSMTKWLPAGLYGGINLSQMNIPVQLDEFAIYALWIRQIEVSRGTDCPACRENF